MGKTGKIILGVLSAWPVVYYGIFTQMVLPAFVSQGTAMTNFGLVLALHLLTALLCFILFVYYLVKTIKNDKLGEQKTAWVLAMIFVGPVAWPAYWYFNMWKKNV